MAEYVALRLQSSECVVWKIEHPWCRPLKKYVGVLALDHPFDWGGLNTGAELLALALLMDVSGDEEVAAGLHNDFTIGVLANMPRVGWTMTSDQVEEWLIRSVAVRELTFPGDTIELGEDNGDGQ